MCKELWCIAVVFGIVSCGGTGGGDVVAPPPPATLNLSPPPPSTAVLSLNDSVNYSFVSNAESCIASFSDKPGGKSGVFVPARVVATTSKLTYYSASGLYEGNPLSKVTMNCSIGTTFKSFEVDLAITVPPISLDSMHRSYSTQYDDYLDIYGRGLTSWNGGDFSGTAGRARRADAYGGPWTGWFSVPYTGPMHSRFITGLGSIMMQFTNDTVNGPRIQWHCDDSGCKSVPVSP